MSGQVLPGFFARLEAILMPEDGPPPLRMARYQPKGYLVDGGEGGEDTALVGLLRTGHLFCATVGERIYLRFVPRESEGELVGELGTCLRQRRQSTSHCRGGRADGDRAGERERYRVRRI